MSLNINLIVHGVPMGQKIWGTKGDDERYISSFYGPKWDAPEVMKVEVMTFGGNTNCYYTFVKGQNVYDSQGRAGAYFALTLRINSFYADIQNLYTILRAAYDKICVGLCVRETNGSTQYILADFQKVDTELKELEKRILGYISEFSVSSDLISIGGLSQNSQTTTRAINLHECSKAVATKVITQFGKLIVSPFYLSESASKEVARYKEESIATTKKAEQEIDMQKKVAQQKIDEITRQSQNEIEAIKMQSQEELIQVKDDTRLKIDQIQSDCEKKIAEIRAEYAGIDLEINSLKEIIRDKEKEILKIKQEFKRKEKELMSHKDENQKPQQKLYGKDDNVTLTKSDDLKTWICNKKKGLIVGLMSVILVVLVVVMCCLFISSLLKKNSESSKSVSQKDVKESFVSKSRISIKEFTQGEKGVVVGSLYHVEIDGQDTDSGMLKSNEFKIEANTIIAKREFVGEKGTIYYLINGNKVDSLEVQIKDSI